MHLFAFKNYKFLSKLDSHVQIDFVPKKLGVLKCHKSLLFKTNNYFVLKPNSYMGYGTKNVEIFESYGHLMCFEPILR
jgi:hypothetical protein